jgi:hypothetical protein
MDIVLSSFLLARSRNNKRLVRFTRGLSAAMDLVVHAVAVSGLVDIRLNGTMLGCCLSSAGSQKARGVTNNQHNKALHPTAYSFVRCALYACGGG